MSKEAFKRHLEDTARKVASWPKDKYVHGMISINYPPTPEKLKQFGEDWENLQKQYGWMLGL